MIGAGTPCLCIAANRDAFAIDEWPIVLDQTFERFPAQIEAVECRVATLKISHDTQGLRIVIEAAKVGETFIECTFAGMSERRMTKIVRRAPALR